MSCQFRVRRAKMKMGIGEAVDATIYRPGQEVPGTVYRVVRHLATGGMGSVYEVEDTSVEKHYVMKTLHPQLLAREDLAKKMKEEAKMLAKLHHPNIVDVVTAGITQDAESRMRVPYYVMERLNGVNLRHMLEKKGALDLVYALRVAIDVLDALEHAHDHGVVHRDVKPENIFLHRNASGTTTTKLLDFGIMRLIDRKSTNVTQGKFVGTIRYASPEQVMGQEVEASSDLYAVGLLLYEMIAGRGPFDDVSEVYAIGMAHVQRPPPPLSQFAPNVPRDIENLVHASLAKKPAERPPDAFTFSSDLRRLMPGGPLSPRAPNVVTPSTPSDPIGYERTEAQAPPIHVTPPGAFPINATSMAAEAQSRPAPSGPTTSVFVPAIIAGVVGAALIGGALLYVVHPSRAPAPTRAAVAPASALAPGAATLAASPSASASASGVPAASSPPSLAVSAAPLASTSNAAGEAVPTAKLRPKAPPPAKTSAPSGAPKKPVRPEDVGFE